MPFQMIRNDISSLQVDALVDFVNESGFNITKLEEQILDDTGSKVSISPDIIETMSLGEAKATAIHSSNVKHIIHTKVPSWQNSDEYIKILGRCYMSSLSLVKEQDCESIALPLVEPNLQGFPKARAMSLAMKCIQDFLDHDEMNIYLVVEDKGNLIAEDGNLLLFDLDTNQFYSDDSKSILIRLNLKPKSVDRLYNVKYSIVEEPELEDILNDKGESFQAMLFRFIDERRLTDPEVYKRANLDKKLFSKIRNQNYRPSKNTAIALAIALRLNNIQTLALLKTLGYTLSNAEPFDIIIDYFIERRIYDIIRINITLFDYDLPLLGSK